jgi:hypothetical protein
MNEIVLIFVSIGLFFFAYEIRPWIVKKSPENRILLDLIVMAVTISTILIPLISLIQNGQIFFGSYLITTVGFVIYLSYYLFKNKNELTGKYRKTFTLLTILYIYIFVVSLFLMIMFAPYMLNITL